MEQKALPKSTITACIILEQPIAMLEQSIAERAIYLCHAFIVDL